MAPTDASPLEADRHLAPPRDLRLLEWQPLAALSIATALLLALHYKAAITDFPFDSAVYWGMATADSPSELAVRGYLFPSILGLFVSIGSAIGIGPVTAFRIFSSLAYAAILTLLVPATCSRLAPGKLSLLRRLCPFVLVAAVFPGLLLYPLSDLPAVAFMWLSVYWMLGSRSEAHPGRAVALVLLAGLAAGAAYNTRTIYIFPALFAALIVLLQFKGRRHHILYAALGAALVCLPQMLLNHQMHGVASPDPTVGYAKTWAVQKTSLFVLQLNSGVAVQRYETTIARGAAPAVHYLDPAGMQLLERICREDGPIESVGSYLRAVSRYPLEFIGIYGRHFINGLDVRDGRAYVTRPSAPKNRTGLACITLVMVLLLAIRSGAAARAQPTTPAPAPDWMWHALLILPTLVIIPGAMETRFMLPLLLYLFATAAAAWSTPAVTSEVRAHPYSYAALALILYAAFFAVTHNTMAQVAQSIPAKALSCVRN